MAATLLLAALANAEHAQHQDGGYNRAGGSQVAGYGANDQQVAHPQSAAPSKAKKIQIVYIKVPLAKLKPSLPSSGGDYSSSDNNTNYGSQHDASK